MVGGRGGCGMGSGCSGWQCWVEKERDRERKRIKNDKERIFK